jgi:menaquinone-dependent protoporphyrinogen oxidase
MEFLVIYASEGGQTRRIADYIVERIEAKGGTAHLIEASARIPDLKFSDYAGVIVAGPVYQQRHPEDLISLVKAHAAEVASVPSAFVSVSLAAAFPDGETESQDYVDRFLHATNWEPSAIHRAAGALRFERYDFFQEQIIRHVVLKDRGADMVEGNNEFTDWDALADFLDDFIGKFGAGAI